MSVKWVWCLWGLGVAYTECWKTDHYPKDVSLKVPVGFYDFNRFCMTILYAQLWGHQIAVDWAEPEIDVDEDIMETVKILYVRNLMIETSEENLRKIFSQFNPGCVERVKKIRDYAFVHFTSRDDAVVAMDNLNGTEIEGSCIEVTLAKPVDKEQYTRYQKASKGTMPSSDSTQQNYVYQCDPYTLAYYGYPYNTLIGPNRDYFIKG